MDAIVTKSGKITPHVHHVDLEQFGMKRICSAFIVESGDHLVILDTGTSDDVRSITRYMKKAGLDQAKVSYLVPSHFHFDHFGGGWKLWQKIVKKNPDVKILTTAGTRDSLQDAALHLQRARRTFGDFVGEMKPLPLEAYEIVEPDVPLRLDWFDGEVELELVSTPGHVPDHVAPVIRVDGDVEFAFVGEAAGTLFHSSKLVTFGTSMPPDFKFDQYIASLEKLMELGAEAIGYCHFGVVKGKENVSQVLQENKEFSFFFRDFVKENYEKERSVRAVVEKFMKEVAPSRTDWGKADLLVKILVALVYGQLVDLGLKQPK